MMSMKLSVRDESPHSPHSANLAAETLQNSEPLKPISTELLSISPNIPSPDKSSSTTGSSPNKLGNLSSTMEQATQASSFEKCEQMTNSENESEWQNPGHSAIGVIDAVAAANVQQQPIVTLLHASDDQPRSEDHSVSDQNSTVVTEPISMISWGPETFVVPLVNTEKQKRARQNCGNGFCSMAHAGRGLRKKSGKENKKFILPTNILDESTTKSPPARRAKPPPPTPPELALLHHSLSTPTLPEFHSISDSALVVAYRDQREIDPQGFDARTREIRNQHIVAKVNRGGSARLIPGDYSVELASREDAARAGRWASRRNATAGLDEFLDTDAASETGYQTPTEHADMILTAPSAERVSNLGEENKGKKAVVNPKLDDKLAEYISSGSIIHQHSRTTEATDIETKIVVKTRIEISQEVIVPKGQSTNWGDIQKTLRRSVNKNPNATSDRLDMLSISEDSDSDSDEDRSKTEAEQLLVELNTLGAGRNDAFAAGMACVKAEVAASRAAGKLRVE